MDAALVPRWIAVLTLLGAAGLPLARVAFPRSPRLSSAFALPLALVVVGVAAYWVGHASFGAVALVVPVVVLFGLTVAAVRFGRRTVFRGPWRRYAVPVLVFAAAFGLVLAIRAVDPAVHPAGGEKFLDFGLLRAVLRADSLPPEDPWFAGEPVRYYYGGPLLAALLARLSGVAPAEAYNLALATWYASLAAGVYGLAGELAERAGRSPRLGGAFGTVLVCLSGTLATPGRALLGLLPRAVAAEYGRALVVAIRASPQEALSAARFLATRQYSYWYARYVIPDGPSVFPLWAFVNGDLRPHVASAPFLVLAAALCFAVYRSPGARRRRALLFVALPPVAGLVTLVNTWTLPTVVGLAWLALALGEAPPTAVVPLALRRFVRAPAGLPRVPTRLVRVTMTALTLSGGPTDRPPVGARASWPRRELRRVPVAAAIAVAVGLLGAAVAAPYLLFHAPTNRGIELFPPRSPLVGLALVHGGFLALFALALARSFAGAGRSVQGTGQYRASLRRPPVAGLLVVVAVVGFAGLVAADLAAVALVGPFLLAGWVAARRGWLGYEAVLIVAGAGVVLAVEFVAARVYPFDPDALRWNTMYKAYWQVWLVWGVAGGVALARVVGGLRDALVGGSAAADGEQPAAGASRPGGAPGADSTARRSTSAIAGVAGVLVLLSAASFGAFALAAHFDDPAEHPGPEPTLDATAFVETHHPGEVEAIEWLGDRRGTPTVVAAPGTDVYGWVNAPSSLTGVPTVAGWRHEIGYRGEAAYQRRVEDVRRLYTSEDPDERRAILASYGVEYVYVGPVERERYGNVAFDASWASVAHRSGDVTIYRVGPNASA